MIGVELDLGDCCVVALDAVIAVSNGEPNNNLVRVHECVNHPFFEQGGPNVDCNSTCVDVLGPVDIQYLLLGSEAFALGRICTGKYVGIL